MVLSTLHTNDAASGVTRLMDMGIEPYLVTSAVNCFVAQRLVRVICRDCKQEAQWTPELLKDFEMTPESAGRVKIYEGKGCRSCRFTGYKGREAIYEFLTMNDEIREMILNRASAGHIKEKAVTQGMRTLRQHGWTKVAAGITSPSEVLRVTHQDIMDD
jgi:type II secretory ATPase GspE/PulE/Tfp pilus assembly ATPase PilB-like protein